MTDEILDTDVIGVLVTHSKFTLNLMSSFCKFSFHRLREAQKSFDTVEISLVFIVLNFCTVIAIASCSGGHTSSEKISC